MNDTSIPIAVYIYTLRSISIAHEFAEANDHHIF